LVVGLIVPEGKNEDHKNKSYQEVKKELYLSSAEADIIIKYPG
jgi:hypothetical protein